MGAIQDIFAKSGENINMSDIQKLIDDKREETRILEYKAPKIIEKPAEISEWVSAFLNADGGLIILGLCESDSNKKNNINAKIFPSKIDFVEGRFTKESIEQIIFSNINCTSKPNIKIFPIRDTSDQSKAIYLIEIPQGDNPPYQAHNNKYYRRLNATKYELPHSEIADFFGRRRKPKLLVDCIVTNPQSFEVATLRKAEEDGVAGVLKMRSLYRLRFIVRNVGLASARYARIVVSFEHVTIEKIVSGPNSRIDYLRNGVPTLQWDCTAGIIYAHSPGGDVVWDLQVKLHKNRVGTISWEAQAEEMDFQAGKLVLSGIETAKQGDDITPYYLRNWEDTWQSMPVNILAQPTEIRDA